MNANKASRRRQMNLAREGFDLRQGCGGRLSTAGELDHIGLADSLARPWRSFPTAEVNHQRRYVFERVEPVGDFGCIECAPGKYCVDAGGIDDLGVDRSQPLTNSALEIAWQGFVSTVDQRHGSCLWRRARRREARRLLGE